MCAYVNFLLQWNFRIYIFQRKPWFNLTSISHFPSSVLEETREKLSRICIAFFRIMQFILCKSIEKGHCFELSGGFEARLAVVLLLWSPHGISSRARSLFFGALLTPCGLIHSVALRGLEFRITLPLILPLLPQSWWVHWMNKSMTSGLWVPEVSCVDSFYDWHMGN